MNAAAASGWLVALRAETRPWHEQLEQRVDLPTRLAARPVYAGLLAAFLGFYAPLESDLADSGINPAFDLPARRKTGLLRADLAALGVPLDSVPRCTALPALDTPARALGALYVIEGATLGGQLISRQLAILGLDADSGGAFFRSYGPQTGAMWGRFRALLATEYAAGAAQSQVIAGAAATFEMLDGWIARCDADGCERLYAL